MDFLKKVQSYILRHNLLENNSTVLVGFSGGADSVALLDVLSVLGYTCVAVHVNFQLRGEEALRDEEFAADFCHERSITFVSERVDTIAFAQKKSISIEMAARKLRYDCFNKMLRELGADKIAVGHHIDDSIETFFINLLRGSGIRGLKGISPKYKNIVRPLLCVDRREILDYLHNRKLRFVTDSTNEQTLYRRNKIRHQLLPLLQSIEPAASKSIFRTMQHLAAPAALYEKEIEEAMLRLKLSRAAQSSPETLSTPEPVPGSKYVAGKEIESSSEGFMSLNLAELEKEPLAADILFEWLSAYGFDFRNIQQIWEHRHAQTGRQFFSDSHRLLLNRGCWLLTERKNNDNKTYVLEAHVQSWTEPLKLTMTFLEAGQAIPTSSRYACLDADKLKFPLFLRRPAPADSFVPFGMKGRKLLSDFFCDRKMNLFQKESCWLLISAEDIVWVLGERIDNRYRVCSSTKRVCCFTISQSEEVLHF